MSFNVEFYASSAADATQILAEASTVPQCVRDFITQGLKACTGPTYVKAWGHLYNNDYTLSSATIEVKPVSFLIPKS